MYLFSQQILSAHQVLDFIAWQREVALPCQKGTKWKIKALRGQETFPGSGRGEAERPTAAVLGSMWMDSEGQKAGYWPFL